ncbi:MAG: lytic murein transglycosylase [Candidatus Paceibacterota bacterium]|jgi:peptidoglycan hydrolase CwlO-like protein|nr:lytic murein transglycosylase [Candidatus Paceibacterota bacterium]
MKKYLSFTLLIAIFSFVFPPIFPLRAESACDAGARISPEDKAQLQLALDACNKEIEAQDKLLKNTTQQKVGIQRDLNALAAQINKALLSIKASDIAIKGLKDDIVNKTLTINELSEKIDREKESISQLLRKTNEIDQSSMVEVVLSQKNLSEFFLDIDSFNSIKNSLRDSLNSIAEAKTLKEKEKGILEEKESKEADAKAEKEVQKRAVQKSEAEKAKLLSITKNTEKEYAKILADKKALSAKIRAALFELRDSNGIQFGQAYDYAVRVSQKTGVRPAFLLAIFSQESSYGKNVGACYLKDPATGAGVGMNTGTPFAKVMKPDRDVEPFLQITSELGRDPYKTRVSCPQSIGWGGAMGPAQFIPSTWMGVRGTIASYLGISMADPWAPLDAFMAAGIYLRDLGAAAGGYTAERNAACRYFSGSKCSASTFAAGYGDSVISKATSIQENQIDKL